ncbi:cytochrome c oxidase subunit, putative [Eimeria tenella]|uniref:Cytochrome c oxidase subunit, putative n=1 Tax=Eimeria tenella TaxID=5802 RepID=U6L3P0_EIMTE|nr:cytochrome c oxidase subunit, putative [Eimeria tenella]CDJ44987.1 cytochrome c oxidase subunit, putative [Eimeria tenella]|eukprot:XP_013235734.1 cytochrome c oxidase subunit, putative [Eimeria tenella]
MDFFQNYWYWRLRAEAAILDPQQLPRKSYKQLARDMGLQIVTEENQHMVGLLELYEYLKTAPFVGPFGTTQNPVLVPSVHTESKLPLQQHQLLLQLLQQQLMLLQREFAAGNA